MADSPLTTAFRAVVMLACLIAIPALALSGKSLPETLQGVTETDWQGRVSSLWGRITGRTPKAPPLGKGTTTGAWGDESSEMTLGLIGPQGRPVPVPSLRVESRTTPQASPAQFDGFAGSSTTGSPTVPPSVGVVATAAPILASYQVPADPPRTLVTPASIGSQVPPPGMVPIRRSTGVVDSGPTSPASQTDRFAHVQQRLRQLGATYCLLESWGNGEQLYRFYCRVGVAGGSGYTRYFEATDADPLVAMGEVLSEVEAWRAGR